jgi:hypothetical protein
MFLFLIFNLKTSLVTTTKTVNCYIPGRFPEGECKYKTKKDNVNIYADANI